MVHPSNGVKDSIVETNGIAELTVNFEFTHPEVAPAWLIGSRTHLLDCWEPQLEWLRMPRLLFDDKEFTASQAFDDEPSRGDVNSDESISVDGLYYDARVHGGSNIAHAILGGAITTLACQFAARKLGLDSVVTSVIPAKTAHYVQEVYRVLGIPTLATDSPVLGQKWQTNFDDSARIGLANQLLPISLVEQFEANPHGVPKRIYLARKGPRSISNSDEVEALLTRQGFTIVYPERLPVIEQFRYLWHADVIVGVHGAALAALIFRVLKKEGAPMCLLELFGPGYVVTLYRHLIAAIGGQWIGVRGRVTPQVVYDLEVLQAGGYWSKLSSKLRGRIPGRFLKQERAWQRTHQSTDFEIDPESLMAALDLMQTPSSEPHPRLIAFEQKIN